MTKKNSVGRPKGTVGSYIPDHLKRVTTAYRLPAWLKERLRRKKGSETGKYIEDLIIQDTGWKPPKK